MQLKTGSHIHLMGICGTAMASLAGLLQQRGFKVSGSDANPYPPMSTMLEKLNIPIQKGYAAANLNPRPDFVIVGNVISRNNPEAEELLRLGIAHTSLPKAMGEFLIENRHSLVVSGTHGKTTTTSVLSWLAEAQGVKPGFLIGGIALNFSQSFKNPEGDFFVIEGDEYDTAFFDKVPKFVHYKPRSVILTSIEFDHADIYKDLDHVKSAFVSLLKLIPADGTLLYLETDQNIKSILQFAPKGRSFSYGLTPASDYRAEILQLSEEGTKFKAYFKNQLLGEFQVLLFGEYNILNALSTLGLAHQLGWNLKLVSEALKSFKGVKRRQELIGTPNGIAVIEDFAHHPTAVRETLKGLKMRFSQRKIWAVFEPRSATSRRKIFQKEYVQAFASADEALIMKAFDQTKIAEEDRFSTEQLVQDMVSSGQRTEEMNTVDEIVQKLKAQARSGDVIVIMSNGGFDGIYQKLLSALS